MEYIWAPWREKYIKKIHEMKECIFCKALSSNNDEETFILLRGNYNFIILNTFPYNCGHLMIAPFSHISSPEYSSEESLMEFFIMMNLSLNVLKEVYSPHGFNIGMNLGKSAGAGVVGHYHLHVVPRWEGDANFMPLFGKTKVLLEDLKTTYSRLFPKFKEKGREIIKKK